MLRPFERLVRLPVQAALLTSFAALPSWAAPQEAEGDDLEHYRAQRELWRRASARYEALEDQRREERLDPELERMREQLREHAVEGFHLDGVEDLARVAEELTRVAPFPVNATRLAREAMFGEGRVLDLSLQHPVRLEALLDLVCAQAAAELHWDLHRGGVELALPDERRRELELRLFVVGDLGFHSEHVLETLMRLGVGGPLPYEFDDLATLVQECVAPASWDQDGVYIAAEPGQLWVRHEAATLRALSEFLAVYRRACEQSAWAGEALTLESESRAAAKEEAFLSELEQGSPVSLEGLMSAAVPLLACAERMEQSWGVDVAIDVRVFEDLDEEDLRFSTDLRADHAREQLDQLARQIEEVRWSARAGVLWFHHEDQFEYERSTLGFYPVWDLIVPGLDPGASVPAEAAPLSPWEQLFVSADSLEGLIRDNLEPESWDANPDYGLQVTPHGVLVVRQHPRVHAQVVDLLDSLALLRRVFGEEFELLQEERARAGR